MTKPLIRRIDTPTGHWYADQNDRPIPGVTTVLKCLPKEALDAWKLRKAVALALEGEDKWSLKPPGMNLVDWLIAAGDREANKAADVGTNAHEFAELHMMGQEPDFEALGKNEQKHAKCYLQFVRDFQPEPVIVEKVLTYIDPKTGYPLYAGTMDLVAKLTASEEALAKVPNDWIDGQTWLCDYKAPLALDTPLPTPTGWTTMGAVRPGDALFDMEGNPTVVTGKSEIKGNPCRRLVFDDGSSIVCDDEHPWVVVDSYPPSRQGQRRIVLTKDIPQTMWNGKKNQQRRLHVEVTGPLDLPPLDLPLDPYVAGAWIGDGTTGIASITLGDNSLPILDGFREAGYIVTSKHGTPGSYTWGLSRSSKLSLRGALKRANIHFDKHIPQLYLRGSLQQRVELLQGLMDAGGSWNRARNRAVINTTNKSLAYQIQELLHSLGERATVLPHNARGFGVMSQAYFIEWRPLRWNPFQRIEYKRELAEAVIGRGTKNWRRTILSAEPTVIVPTQCITVDSPTSTFLCGESMIPTHNSSSKARSSHALQSAAYRYATHWLDPVTGELHEMVPVDKTAVILLNGGGAGHCYRMIELDSSPVVFSVFKSLLRIHNFSKIQDRVILGKL